MEDIRINFIGDSYVNGTGDPQYLGWPGRVCAASNGKGAVITGYNLGIRADTSADILRRWQGEVAARRLVPQEARLVFGFGANDCWIIEGQPRVNRAESESNAEEILSRAKELLPTLMIGPPPGLDADEHARRQDMSVLLQGIAARVGVPYLDVIAGLGEGESEIWRAEVRAGDRVHPGAGGYGVLAEVVLQWPEWWFYKG
ncbi:MAG: lysophospholipase L1-like esterase [Candidatus Latescibacterota bacterium]